MSKVARSADLRMFEDCESFEETEQSGSHMVSKGTFDTYLIIFIHDKTEYTNDQHLFQYIEILFTTSFEYY